MKKRITGVIASNTTIVLSSGKMVPKKIRVKGWKVNPYVFIHKSLNSNWNPVRGRKWCITHIPTGLSIRKDVELKNALTIKTLKMIVDKWYPAWSMRIVKKDPKNNITEEHRIRHKGLLNDIEALQNKIEPDWRI
jgi:hypothetical protein